jgi:protein gp37
MCDIFEINLADDLIPYAREQLWKMIEMTDHLMWLLLTKRPENVLNLVPWETHADWPINVATGTSVEDQNTAAARIPLLLEIPAWFKFLSIEPMIGPVDLEKDPSWLYQMTPVPIHDPDGSYQDCDYHVEPRSDGIDWVIVGGESGSNARPMDIDWVRDLREQCVRADISFFVKQLGSHWAKAEGIHKIRGHKKGEGILSWPEDLRIQQKPLSFSSRHVFTAPEKSQKGA